MILSDFISVDTFTYNAEKPQENDGIEPAHVKLTVCQKQLSRGALRKRCFENMQQIYRKTSKAKCDFKCSPVNLLHIFRTLF